MSQKRYEITITRVSEYYNGLTTDAITEEAKTLRELKSAIKEFMNDKGYAVVVRDLVTGKAVDMQSLQEGGKP